MHRQRSKGAAGEGTSSKDSSPLSLLVNAADAQHPKAATNKKRTSSTASKRGKPALNGILSPGSTKMNEGDRGTPASSVEEQLLQRHVAALQEQHQQNLLQGLSAARGGTDDLYNSSTFAAAAAAQQQQQQAAALDLVSHIRAAAVRQAQARQQDFLRQQLLQGVGGLGSGNSGLDPHLQQELEIQRLQEMERRHLLASAMGGGSSGGQNNAFSVGLLARHQLELEQAALRQQQLGTGDLDRAGLEGIAGGARPGSSALRPGAAGDSRLAALTAGNRDDQGANKGVSIAPSDVPKDSFQKTPGAVVVPCRARGMPMDHNFKTAYFVIPENVEHGEELICSYFACRNAGIKFRYCTHCKVPVAKRNFRKRHKHGKNSNGNAGPSDEEEEDGKDSDDQSSSTGQKVSSPKPSAFRPTHAKRPSSASKDSEVEASGASKDSVPAPIVSRAPPESSDSVKRVIKQEEVENVRSSAPTKTSETPSKDTAGSKSGASKSSSIVEAKKGRNVDAAKPREADVTAASATSATSVKADTSARIDEARAQRWGSLLGRRPPTNDSDAMSAWLLQVLAVSDLDKPLQPADAPPENTETPKSADEAVRSPPVKSGDKEEKPEDKERVEEKEEDDNVSAKKRTHDEVSKEENDEKTDSAIDHDKAADGSEASMSGFAEWKDRKKYKGLPKKSFQSFPRPSS